VGGERDPATGGYIQAPANDGAYDYFRVVDYFCGKVYNYKYTISGNVGENFPEESLNNLFGEKRLYSSLTQVYNAKKSQRWRSQIDSLFE